MIINAATNEAVPCYFRKVELKEIKERRYNPLGGWAFDWKKPIGTDFEVYGLVTEEYPDEVQGLVAVRANYHEDFRCVFLDIVESAPHNKKIAPRRKYIGVGKVLVAFAAQYSKDHDLDGCVSLTSKSNKIDFYEGLSFLVLGSREAILEENPAKLLMSKYLPGGVKWWPKR
jgi:ribosomal protein S18 acetylase RimI-like enzyme